MFTKKFFYALVLFTLPMQINAQLKVTTTGEVSIGGNFTPNGKLHVLGNGVFSTSTSFTYAPMIRAQSTTSSATTPDFTWWGNDQTGIFHPAVNDIGFTAAGSEKMRIKTWCVRISTAALFGNSDDPASAAYIRQVNAYSTASTPDYTWWNNDQVGIFHPASNVIGFSVAATEIMRITNANVGIGATSPASTLSVGGSGNALWKGYFRNNSTSTGAMAIRAEVATPTDATYAYGVSAGITCGTGYTIGLVGNCSTASPSGGRAYGVYGQVGNATSGYNYGVYGFLSGSNAGAAIYGTESGDVDIDGGLFGSTNTFAGFFNGDLLTTDDSPEKPTAGSWSGYSDKRLKKDIKIFSDGLNVLRKLNPVSYQFNGIGNLPTGKSYIGVLAQDIKEIAPYCIGETSMKIKQSESSAFSADGDVFENVAPDTSGIAKSIVKSYTFNYDGLVYVLINSVKQLDSSVTDLEKATEKYETLQQKYDSMAQQLNELEQFTKQCCTVGSSQNGTGNDNNGNLSVIQTELANKNNFVLYQNEPNPFSNQTVIRYFLPENAMTVFIVFHDEFGKEVNKVEVKEKGFGKIEASTTNLASGIYTYSIIANGKTMDTKKMIRSK